MPYDALMRWEWEGGGLPLEAGVRDAALTRRGHDEERRNDVGDDRTRRDGAREAGAGRDGASETDAGDEDGFQPARRERLHRRPLPIELLQRQPGQDEERRRVERDQKRDVLLIGSHTATVVRAAKVRNRATPRSSAAVRAESARA
jgi:hypothetical protein